MEAEPNVNDLVSNHKEHQDAAAKADYNTLVPCSISWAGIPQVMSEMWQARAWTRWSSRRPSPT